MFFQTLAQHLCKDMKDVDKQLAFLPMEMGGKKYIEFMTFAQEFAQFNRKIISSRIIDGALGSQSDDIIESVHNYISPIDNIIRKGAISATKGEEVVIPLNMRDGTIVGVGRGKDDYNNSAPHGAGRRMSRSQAKKSIALADYIDTMENVWSSSVNERTLDEAPFAYKDSGEIISMVEDTIEIKDIMKPVYNLKA